MKNFLLFLAIMVVSIIDGYSQASFNTGALEVSVSEYGRIRLFTPDGTRHLQRASIIVGTASGVFDYTNDAEALDPTVLVATPLMSDYEIYGSNDNSYSELPPDVIVKYNAFGWNNGGYTIIKFNITNAEATPMTPLIGLDIIPELNEEYGFDTVTYNSSEGIIRFHRGAQVNMGMKLLSDPLTSLYSFEWYDGYTVDADYWNWMNYGLMQPEYISTTVDGPVTITSQDEVAINPGESFEVFYAMALGADEQTMLSGISAAVQKYQSWFNAVEDIGLPVNEIKLVQNYPNPFDHSTTISYQLPGDGFVSLKIFNTIGKEVATLVDSKQKGGLHKFVFDAKDLAGGVYYCTLRFNDQVKSNKMFLVK